jgi:hypothetical protein
MKKFFITLLILLILGGTVFFFGWAQLSVPPGSYGVIISKTHGVDPQPVHSGEFRWTWYKLIPTNVEIPVFNLKPERFPIEFNSSLPSGDVYSSFAGLGTDFSWNLKAVISFSINPEELVQVVSSYNIMNQQDLDAHLHDIAQSIEVLVLRLLSSGETDTLRLERILSGRPDEEMEREIARQFPEIHDFSFVIESARFPDFILYTQVRLIYEEFLAKQREYVTSAFGRTAESHIESQLRFDELERYGELLTRYPVLLEYLLMEYDNTNQ